ncbi:hypothetical protein AYK21_03455 [Thermoplasmatales archaeon SG8-52-2]|nr:MAG: hypothetical protein AYK21_03455 [Thermoplasmatales archaeon SG8-52-2]
MHCIKNKTIYNQMTKSEKKVAEFLKNLGIRWSYEHPVFVWDENKRPRVWAPDFYLISLGIYVEACGSENFDYEYRRRIFDNNGLNVIFLHLYKENNQWKNHLIRYINFFTSIRDYKLNTILEK